MYDTSNTNILWYLQSWFTSVWNYSVVPYLVEAAREGVALYGRRGAWADPAKYVRDSYPWPDPEAAQVMLQHILFHVNI